MDSFVQPERHSMKFTQQPVAIVTGASSGIGLGLTQALLERGYRANHAALAKFHPLARMGEIPDIVDAVLYLQNATFVTGENIRVDGGVHAGR
jgi:NAD(P)-dependent dehydrogenase (short-subunit alcohol dehydrogenase family)